MVHIKSLAIPGQQAKCGGKTRGEKPPSVSHHPPFTKHKRQVQQFLAASFTPPVIQSASWSSQSVTCTDGLFDSSDIHPTKVESLEYLALVEFLAAKVTLPQEIIVDGFLGSLVIRVQLGPFVRLVVNLPVRTQLWDRYRQAYS